MSTNVFANLMAIVCKAAKGKSICAAPNVCFAMPQTPAMPTGMPVPLTSTGMASDTTDGSRTVQICGQEVMLKNQSYFKRGSGDEAGNAPKKGILTAKNMGKVYFSTWAINVLIEGLNVVRHLDLTTHNHASMPGNTPPWPYLDSMTSAGSDAGSAAGSGSESRRTGSERSSGQNNDNANRSTAAGGAGDLSID